MFYVGPRGFDCGPRVILYLYNIIAIKTRSGERRSRMGAKRFRRDRDDDTLAE